MANRFNKGIDNLKQADSTPITETQKTEKSPFIEEKQVNSNMTNIKDNVLTNTNANTLNNILDNILISEQSGANYTFYLSKEVSKAITDVAKEKKVSKSKLVDTILKQVLLDK